MSIPPILPQTAPFAEEQIAALNKVFATTNAEQRVWLSGFLAGVQAATASAAPNAVALPAAAPAAAARPKVPLTILFATESGNAEALADEARKAAGKLGFSARLLDNELHEHFREDQIFRIDHYLGKETVQNILVFRFGNSLFERVWNRDAVDHVQITVAESIGVEGRGQFYEEVGALRDIMQNHLLQILSLLTMEPPSSFRAEAIRDEKAKLLASIPPVDPRAVVRGQYATGVIDDDVARGYRDEPDVSRASNTETFVAMRLNVQNWRWEGVPFYLRTGKRMPETVTEINVVFREAPIRFFSELPEVSRLRPNQLTLRIQPEESITFSFLAKEPGPEVRVQPVRMHFAYSQAFETRPPEAYERLLHDAMEGDQTLFLRSDGVEEAWRIIEPVLENMPPLRFYAAGSWGPPQIDDLIEPRRWRLQ